MIPRERPLPAAARRFRLHSVTCTLAERGVWLTILARPGEPPMNMTLRAGRIPMLRLIRSHLRVAARLL